MTILAAVVFIAIGIAAGFGLFSLGMKYGMNYAVHNSVVLQQARAILLEKSKSVTKKLKKK